MRELAKETHVSLDWLNRVKHGRIKDPSVGKVEKLLQVLEKYAK